jgi:hypothetical protein
MSECDKPIAQAFAVVFGAHQTDLLDLAEGLEDSQNIGLLAETGKVAKKESVLLIISIQIHPNYLVFEGI